MKVFKRDFEPIQSAGLIVLFVASAAVAALALSYVAALAGF